MHFAGCRKWRLQCQSPRLEQLILSLLAKDPRGRPETVDHVLAELDPNFALARARLAYVHALIALTYDTTFNRREQVRLESEAALRLDPGLPEAHYTLASYYRILGDHARADAQLQLAIAAAPNRSELRIEDAFRLRHLGLWKEATDELENAIRLDARNTMTLREAAMTYSRLRRYEDGIAAWDRVIALDATDVVAQQVCGYNYLHLGIIDSLAAIIERTPPEHRIGGQTPLARSTTWSRYTVLRAQRRHTDALAMLDSVRHAAVGDGMFYRPIILLRALTLDEMGEPARTRPAYETARVLLEDSVRAKPRDARFRIALGLAYAGVGRKADASAEARTAMELQPLTSRTLVATAFMSGAVEVFIKAGEHDEAIRLIELLLSMPAGREVSVPLLRMEPDYDPLRGDSRFEQLLLAWSSAALSSRSARVAS